MFRNKPKRESETDAKQIASGEGHDPYKKPMVFLFDFDESVVKKLKELRINTFEGSFGCTLKVKNKQYERKYLKAYQDFPQNLHEFDVVMMDLTNNNSEDYDPSQHELSNVSGDCARMFLSAYPEQIFDPRPFAIYSASKDINYLFDKQSIIIAFCGSNSASKYQFVEITGLGTEITDTKTFSNFSFYKDFPNHDSRCGEKVKLPEKKSKLSPLFSKYIDNISFETFFYHPTAWHDGRHREMDNFHPLLLNERDEIVSYAHLIGESVVFVFPDIADKPSFVAELFRVYLPEMLPETFPFHGEFKWLESGDYPLPGENTLQQQRAELEEKYNRDVAEHEKTLGELKVKYKFLSDLITETGSALVTAVEAYLKWLGFESVVNLDDTNPEILEEDIQVDGPEGFLVIEIKGIGGTSTDKDCSQISKIKFRRAEQRGNFDVYGIYIVNHQRYMPPASRSNPPFTASQISDAVYDKRGLLTTYDMYKSYFMIEDGILEKSDVRESLFKTGLIVLEPANIVSLGIANEIFMDGNVAIVNLNNITITVGETLIVKRQDTYSKTKIVSLQVTDKSVETCNMGEVGIKLDIKIKKNSELFVRTL